MASCVLKGVLIIIRLVFLSVVRFYKWVYDIYNTDVGATIFVIGAELQLDHRIIMTKGDGINESEWNHRKMRVVVAT